MNITIEEYRARLYAALAAYDRNEVAQAVNYYIELIEDADDPAIQMAKLGAPEQLAQRIIADNGWSNLHGQNGYNGGFDPNAGRSSGSGNIAGRIIALIFTAPLWLSVFILILSLLIVVWSVFIALPAGTLAGLFESVRWFGKYMGYSGALFFAALGCAGLTVLFYAPARAATSAIFKAVVGFSRFLFGNTDKPEKYELKKAKNRFSKGALIMGAIMTAVGAGISTPLFVKAANSPEKFSKAVGLETHEFVYGSDSDNIKIDVKSGCTVYLLPTSDTKAKLRCENILVDKAEFRDSASGIGFTYDYERKNSFHINFITDMGNTSSKFYLYLPEKEYGSAEIRLSLGDVKIEDFTAKDINIENDCGDIKLKGVKQTGEGFNVTSHLGDIKLENCNIGSSSAHMTQSSGDVKYNGGSIKSLKVDNSLGSIKLENITADTLELNNHCGDIKLENTAVTGSITSKLELGDARFELKGKDYSVIAQTDLGDVKVNGKKITEAPAGGTIPVNISNNAGDIKVEFN